MSEELRPCPFCGEAGTYTKDHERSHHVFCRKCDNAGTCEQTADEAVRLWNTRAADSEIAALREENRCLKEKAKWLEGANQLAEQIQKLPLRAEFLDAKCREAFEGARKVSGNVTQCWTYDDYDQFKKSREGE